MNTSQEFKLCTICGGMPHGRLACWKAQYKPCPFCGGMPHVRVDLSTSYAVVCGSCGAMTDVANSADEARELWQARREV